MPLSIYVHIPFCEIKCGYCDFYSVPRGFDNFNLQEKYVDQLIREIDERSDPFAGRPILSIFFGGGTPSLLAPKLLEKILSALRRHFTWEKGIEITLEANPKTVSRESLAAFRSLGVNRISIGVQSFEDRFLKALGRIHTADEARRTIDDARHAGFDAISLDLIFALPGQTLDDWKKDIEEAIAMGTPHLSAYHLAIEKGTPFDVLQKGGGLNLPSEEEGVRLLLWTRERLYQVRMEPYEISNFSFPGSESVHNRNYWRYGEYLGFGTAAASFIKNPPNPPLTKGGEGGFFRCTNVRDLKRYLAGEWEGSSETIDRRLAMGEFCMLALRTREGIEEERFGAEFGESAALRFEKELGHWVTRGWLRRVKNGWPLTSEGVLFADEVAASFL